MDGAGETPFFMAVRHCDSVDSLLLLLEHDPTVIATLTANNNGDTPLHLFCRSISGLSLEVAAL